MAFSNENPAAAGNYPAALKHNGEQEEVEVAVFDGSKSNFPSNWMSAHAKESERWHDHNVTPSEKQAKVNELANAEIYIDIDSTKIQLQKAF